MIYITGDCHGNFERFTEENFPEQKDMTKDDYVIICGDFGGVWSTKQQDKAETEVLNWLNDRPFTTLFICGNHENFDRLRRFPMMIWKGGKVHRIRPSIYHLMRGQVFNLQGKTFFTFGGATSHDVQGGIFEPDDLMLRQKIARAKQAHLPYRVNKKNWWKEELPSGKEMEEGLLNLSIHCNRVDFIITHCCASSTQALMSGGLFKPDILTVYLEKIKQKAKYKKWFFGHYHQNMNLNAEESMLYEQIIRIL